MIKYCIVCDSSNFEIKSDLFCSQKCIHKYASTKAVVKVRCHICEKDISKNNYKKHIKTHESKNHNYICENCGKEVIEKYGSARFCSSKCARGFSTKNKREIINNKVRSKLEGHIFTKKCIICNDKFTTKQENRQTCSKKCGAKLVGIKNLGSRHTVRDSSKMGGLREKGGKSKQFDYINWMGYKMYLNKEEIKVAEELDSLKLNWRRNTTGFPYTTKEGINRKYYPDFVVNEKLYIEYKGWITDEMEHKMNDAKRRNNLNLIIVIGDDRRYFGKGIMISEIKNISVV